MCLAFLTRSTESMGVRAPAFVRDVKVEESPTKMPLPYNKRVHAGQAAQQPATDTTSKHPQTLRTCERG